MVRPTLLKRSGKAGDLVQRAEGRTRRLFVAVPPPSEVLEFLLEAQRSLPSVPGLRTLGREQLHVTLAFIGEVGVEASERARAAVRGLSAMVAGEAVAGGFLLLPDPRRARVVAVGVDDRSAIFAGLHASVMLQLVQGGLMERENREYRPHVSVARLRRPGPVRPTHESGSITFRVESVRLYESRLTREGAEYHVLEESQLQKRNVKREV